MSISWLWYLDDGALLLWRDATSNEKDSRDHVWRRHHEQDSRWGNSMSRICCKCVYKGWEDPIPNWELIRTQNPTQSSSRGGIYNITQDLELQSTISSLARMLEELETMIEVCAMCESKEYVTIKCLTISIVKIKPLKA